MYAARVRSFAVVACLLAPWVAGCPAPAAECGDGEVGPGETEASCCLDTGCAFGACDAATRRCLDPWWETCAGSDQCVAGGPRLCRDQAPPAYDCETCGCPDDGRCRGGACFSVGELAGERERDDIPFDLPIDDYFALLDELARAPLTLAELTDELVARARADRRAAGVVVGGIETTADEAAVATALAEGLGAAGFAVREHAVDGFASCADAGAVANGTTADERVDVAFVSADVAHREVCEREALFPSCALPTVSDCALAAGRVPLTVIALDHEALLERVDHALLLRATNVSQGQVLTILDSVINRWRQTVDTLPVPEEHEVELASGTRVVRGALAREDPPLFWLSLVSRERPPYGLFGFRVLWSDAATQQFLIDNDLTGRDCDWSLDGEALSFVCDDGTARLEAEIDTSDFSLTNVTTTAS